MRRLSCRQSATFVPSGSDVVSGNTATAWCLGVQFWCCSKQKAHLQLLPPRAAVALAHGVWQASDSEQFHRPFELLAGQREGAAYKRNRAAMWP